MDVLAAGPELKRGDTVTGVSQVGLTVSRQHHSPPTPQLPCLLEGSGSQGCCFTHTPFPEAFTLLRLLPGPSSSAATRWAGAGRAPCSSSPSRRPRWGDKGLS